MDYDDEFTAILRNFRNYTPRNIQLHARILENLPKEGFIARFAPTGEENEIIKMEYPSAPKVRMQTSCFSFSTS